MRRAGKQVGKYYGYVFIVFMFIISCIFSNMPAVERSNGPDFNDNLFYVVQHQSVHALEKILKERKSGLNIQNKYGLSLIAHAILFDRFEQAQLLLRYDVPVNHYEKADSTALALALTCSAPEATEMVKLLITSGANPNQKDRAGVSLLQRSCRAKLKRNWAMGDALIKVLIERGAHVTSDMIDVPQKYHDFAQEQALLFKESLCDIEKAHNVPRMVTRMIGDFAGVAQEALPETPDYSAWMAGANSSLHAQSSPRPAKRRRL